MAKIVFTKNIGKGKPPDGMDARRWRQHGINMRRIEKATGIAPLNIDGWETVAIVLLNKLEKRK